jgi:thiamine pyrophosphate-dependent acetolactate synthase large subunit-like protein
MQVTTETARAGHVSLVMEEHDVGGCIGLAAAIGARAARRGTTAVCIDGDGSVQMTVQALATAVAADLPKSVVILDNGVLGVVRHWQMMFYDERHSEARLGGEVDCAEAARGFGAPTFTVVCEAGPDRAPTSGRAAAIDAVGCTK